MNENPLKQAIENASKVKQQSVNSFVSTWSSAAYSGAYQGQTTPMIPNGMADPNGVIKYTYDNDREEEEILDHIEKEGLVILDESDEDSQELPHWYEVIKPHDLKKNVDNIKYLSMPSTEDQLKESIDEFENDIMEIGKTQPRSITFKDLAKKMFEVCKKEFL